MTTLVLIQMDDTGVSEVSLETLAFARSMGGPVTALVLGEVSDEVRARLGGFGVSRIVQASGDGFAAYAPGAWAAAVVAAADRDVHAVLAAGTPRGNEVMAHVACRRDVLMAANVVRVESQDDGEPLEVSRQVYGGTTLEVMGLSEDLAVLSVAGHACAATPADGPTDPDVETIEVSLSAADLAVRVARTEAGAPDESGNLKTAKVVVGAGRGAGSADGFNDLIELSELLDGSLGVSRVVTSLGWRPHHEQVGQTGSRITPDLYIPCGISGAIQHWAGCSSAKTILAINSDPDAPMVTRAHYAVIGDLHEIVPAVNEEIRRRAGV
ncbi:MAG: electron transfer flavoprotein subunit alpha/FixB family protein [Ornithinimicrobium sp.]|uniref:electron transfer flavoprotein subunit alpha/FixB family protein n=1 Tax=Ornithinimicrobium sp. TaxID=1977084 RepID=UPI0017D17688|nr:electron transfer flavoprotein subunit alpha/FixB family protein [Actinomycetota bacterium]